MAREQITDHQLFSSGTLGVRFGVEQMVCRATTKDLTTAINDLPALERLILSLLYVDRLTAAEAAAVTEMGEVELHSVRQRAVRQLEEILNQA